MGCCGSVDIRKARWKRLADTLLLPTGMIPKQYKYMLTTSKRICIPADATIGAYIFMVIVSTHKWNPLAIFTQPVGKLEHDMIGLRDLWDPAFLSISEAFAGHTKVSNYLVAIAPIMYIIVLCKLPLIAMEEIARLAKGMTKLVHLWRKKRSMKLRVALLKSRLLPECFAEIVCGYNNHDRLWKAKLAIELNAARLSLSG